MLEQRLEQIRQKVASVQGWVGDAAGMKLYQLARFHSPNGVVVELGSWKGRSTLWLAHAVHDRGEGNVFAVDTWRGTVGEEGHSSLLADYNEGQLFEEFRENMRNAGVLNWVEPLVGETLNIFDQFPKNLKVGVLFIDACHEYEAVKADFDHWSTLVADNGYIVFDDVPAWPGPTKFILDLPPNFRIRSIWQNNCVVKKMRPENICIADLLQEVYQSRRLFNDDFIQVLYNRLLERSPNEEERQACLQYMTTGGDITKLIQSMIQSEGFLRLLQ